MKVRTQDSERYLEFGETHMAQYGTAYGVFISNHYHNQAMLAGVYAEEARARGVIYEIGLSYQAKDRVFYMPME